jgi:hypothetical protein
MLADAAGDAGFAAVPLRDRRLAPMRAATGNFPCFFVAVANPRLL